MNENIKKFLEKVEADKELQAKMAQLRDPDEAYKVASSVQEGFTKEEFITEMKRIYTEHLQDLSEDDIAKVAGGVDGSDVAATVVSSIAAATASAFAAVVAV